MARLKLRDEGRGPAVLLIHGYPLGSWMWEPQVQALRDRYRVLAPDLRGFGDSPLPSPACGMDDYADDLAELLAGLGVERAAVVGFSMGGYIALSLAERRPELLSALVLADTRAAPDSDEARQARTTAAEQVLREGAAPIAAAMAGKLLAPGAEQRQPGLVTDLRARMEQVAPESIACALGAMRDRPDRRRMLGGIAVPTLVVVGSEDVLTPPKEAKAMALAIPGARIALVLGAGHLSNLEAPAQFNTPLLDFLEEVLWAKRGDT